MRKAFLYGFLKWWLSTALLIFYKSIKVVNKQRVPKKGPVIVVANHQNTLLDPLLIAAFMPRTFFFLLRASFFKSKVGSYMANMLNMMPIYRRRDGVEDIREKNDEIFQRCVALLNKNKTILIFPEGSHLGRWTLRPFQKGFTRIAQAYLSQPDAQPLTILPIGLNYFDLTKATDHVIINVGKPITLKVSESVKEVGFLNQLRDEAHAALQNVVLHIPDNEDYEAMENDCKHLLHEKGSSINLLKKAQAHVVKNEIKHVDTYYKPSRFYLIWLLWPIHIIPHMVASKIRAGIKDPQFKPSIYVVISLVVHTIQAIIAGFILLSYVH